LPAVTSSPNEQAEAVLTASRGLLGLVVRSLLPTLQTVRLEDFRILVILSSRGNLTRQQLANLEGATALAIDESLRRLSMDGRVDVHGSIATLTIRGRALVDEVTERRRTEIAKVLGGLDEDARRRVIDGLQTLAEHLGCVAKPVSVSRG